jgi:hypothetical protein
MTARAAGDSSLASDASSLESQRGDLLRQIDSAKQRIESQRRDAAALAALLLLDSPPSLPAARQRLAGLQSAIAAELRERRSLEAAPAQPGRPPDATAALRERQAEYDRRAAALQALARRFAEEWAREAALRSEQARLTGDLLRARLAKRRAEAGLAGGPPRADVAALQRKKRALLGQLCLVSAERGAFERELAESAGELGRLRLRSARRAAALDAGALQRRILQAAAENTELRGCRPVPAAAERLLGELTQLARSCASLIERARLLIE